MTQGHDFAPSLGFLIVEDDTVAAIELECILEDLGHRIVAVAVAPLLAKRAFRDLGSEIDAVVFGAELVGLPSTSLAHWLRRTNLPLAVSAAEPLDSNVFPDLPVLEKPYRAASVATAVHGMTGRAVAPAA